MSRSLPLTDDTCILVCARRGFLGKTYELSRDAELLGTISFRGTSQCKFTLDSGLHVVAREAPGVWSLSSGNFVLASARRLQDKPLSIELEFDGNRWLIQAHPKRLLRFDIIEGASVIGKVQSKIGFASNRLEVHAPAGHQTAILIFVTWIVGIHWSGIVGVAPRAFAEWRD